MLEMYKGVANSPETTITNDINNADTIIYILDETRVPDLPNLMVLGTGIGSETIKVLSIEGNAITVERAFQGMPRAWNAGTIIARNFTEYDYNALLENINTLKTYSDTNTDDINSLNKADIGLNNVDNTSDIDKPISTKTQAALNGKVDNTRVLTDVPVGAKFTDTIYKAGTNVSISEDNTINASGNVDSVNDKTGVVEIDVVDIPGLSEGNNIAIGMNATNGASECVALGFNSSNSGFRSVAIGSKATARQSGVALGEGAKSSGLASTAISSGSESSGDCSSAIGRGSKALNANEGVLGGADSYVTSIWKVPGSFSVTGTKNFEMPHPKPEKLTTHVIRHASVESPTAGDNLYRYKIKSTKASDIQLIELPDYFIHLNKDVQIFVTPQGHFGNGYGNLNREVEQLEIHCQSEGDYNILVIGTRNDNHQSVQDWDIKGVEREIGESWTGETHVFEIDEITETEEIKEAI